MMTEPESSTPSFEFSGFHMVYQPGSHVIRWLYHEEDLITCFHGLVSGKFGPLNFFVVYTVHVYVYTNEHRYSTMKHRLAID